MKNAANMDNAEDGIKVSNVSGVGIATHLNKDTISDASHQNNNNDANNGADASNTAQTTKQKKQVIQVMRRMTTREQVTQATQRTRASRLKERIRADQQMSQQKIKQR